MLGKFGTWTIRVHWGSIFCSCAHTEFNTVIHVIYMATTAYTLLNPRNVIYDISNNNCLITYTINSAGRIHGRYTVHTLDGHLLEKCNYNNGLCHGVKETYCVSGGILTSCSNYVHGKLHGDVKRWSHNGHLLLHERYNYGVQHGVQERYYLTGIICQRYTAHNGQYDGAYELYDAFGKPMATYVYNNGQYVSRK